MNKATTHTRMKNSCSAEPDIEVKSPNSKPEPDIEEHGSERERERVSRVVNSVRCEMCLSEMSH